MIHQAKSDPQLLDEQLASAISAIVQVFGRRHDALFFIFMTERENPLGGLFVSAQLIPSCGE